VEKIAHHVESVMEKHLAVDKLQQMVEEFEERLLERKLVDRAKQSFNGEME
jgi:AmiR/NasT family two-component response regulator